MKRFLCLILVLWLSSFMSLQASDLKVGIKSAMPFAYQENGEWKGLSVDLLNQISDEQGFTYTLVPTQNISTLLKDVTSNKVDMSLAAISITPEREKILDFSHKYFTTNLGILTKNKSSFVDNAIWMGKRLLIILVVFVGFLYIVGFIMDKVDGDENISSSHEGAWWALVTFTTTGYGDLVPKTNKGKTVAAIWMVASLFLLSLFTGYVASAITVKKLTESPTRIADLYNTKVGSVASSTGQQKLNALGIKNKPYYNLDKALKKFDEGVITAVVYDAAMLKYVAASKKGVNVWNLGDNSEENYAIALPTNSTLTEQVNVSILNIIASPQWEVFKLKYNL